MAHAPFFPVKNFIFCFFLPTTDFPPIVSCFFQKVLASHGAAKVSAYVTHAVFPKQSYERFMTSNSGNWQKISSFAAMQTFCRLPFCFLQLGQATSLLTSGSQTHALTQ